MQSLTYFELDLNPCVNIYGSAPCQASLGVTGDKKCFNSVKTCQDRANFRKGLPIQATLLAQPFASNTTDHNVAMPATVPAGALLLVLLTTDGDATVTTPGGWTSLGTVTRGSDVRGSLFGIKAAGTEGGTNVNFVTSGSEAAAAQVFMVDPNNWGGTLATDVAVQTADPGSDTDAPVPPALTPAWDEATAQWLVAVFGSTAAVSAYPMFFRQGKETVGGAGASGASVATAQWLVKAPSMEPGAFALGASVACVAMTIAIKPFREAVTLRFALPVEELPKDIPANACIKSVQFTPAIVSFGENLGERATLKVTFAERKHPDAGPGYDPYLADRDYTAWEHGTHWARVLARHPYLRGQDCRLIYGEVGQPLANMETRHFIAESVDGPFEDGSVTIIAKDRLKNLDPDRAVAPRPSNGFIDSDINTGAGSVTLEPAGIGDEYPGGQFRACIGGKEVVLAERTSGDTFSIARAQLGTAAQSHTDGDRFQVVYYEAAKDAADIFYNLCAEYAEINPVHLPLDAWRNETAAFLNRLYTLIYVEPTGVNEIASNLIKQCPLAVWHDDLASLIKLQVVRAVSTTAAIYDDRTNIVENSLRIRQQPEKRASRVRVYFAPADPTEGREDPKNFRSGVVALDLQAEADYGQAAEKVIYAWGIPFGARVVAQKLAELSLSRFRLPPRRADFQLFKRSSQDGLLGSGGLVTSWTLQDDEGAREPLPIQINSVSSSPGTLQVQGEEMIAELVSELPDNTVIIDSDQNNINLKSIFESVYPPAGSGDDVFFIIESSVTIGSASTNSYALRTGVWASGVNVHVTNRGKGIGCGGKGGKGGNVRQDGEDGRDGGGCLLVEYPITLDNGAGMLAGGGGGAAGGGGGGPASGGTQNTGAGGGGGGGAGRFFGLGGKGGKGGGNGDSRNGKHGKDGFQSLGGEGGKKGTGASGQPSGGDGGNAGNLGQSGGNGENGAGATGGDHGTGGAPGPAINGVSLVTFVAAGDIRGPQIN